MGLGWGRSPRTTGLQAPAARAWTGPAEARHPTPAGCARGRVSGPLGESGYSLATSRALSSEEAQQNTPLGGPEGCRARLVRSARPGVHLPPRVRDLLRVMEKGQSWDSTRPCVHGRPLPLLLPCRPLYASASSPWQARVRAGPHLGPWPTSLYRAPGSCHHCPLPLHWNSPISSAGHAHHHAAWLVPAAPS